MLRIILSTILIVSIAIAFEASMAPPAEARKITKSFNHKAYNNTSRAQVNLAKRTQQKNRARAVQRLNLAISKAQTRSRQAAETAKKDAAARAEKIKKDTVRKRRENVNGVIISRLISHGGTIRSAASPYNAGPVAVQLRGLAQSKRVQLKTKVSRLPLAVARQMPQTSNSATPQRPRSFNASTILNKNTISQSDARRTEDLRRSVVCKQACPPKTTENLTKGDRNDIIHIFDKPEHKMDRLVRKFGSREAAFVAIHNQAQKELDSGNLRSRLNSSNRLIGVYRISVGGIEVDLVGGRKIGDTFRIGSASMRDIPEQ